MTRLDAPDQAAPTRLAAYRTRFPPAQRGRISDGVADILREAILDGVIEPGAWLREVELARELDVSRTPIRDAFRTLTSEGFLNTSANQGVVVAPITTDDIVNLYTVREALEGLAARLVARRAPKHVPQEFEQLLEQMQRAGDEQRFEDLARLNLAFHRVIRNAAGNRYLDRSLIQIENTVRRFRPGTTVLPGRTDESVHEHVALAKAIVDGDAVTAERLAIAHMRRLAELRLRMLIEGYC